MHIGLDTFVTIQIAFHTMSKASLNLRQIKFVAHYLKSGNATQSAIKAGYSKKTADVAGPRLLGNVRIKAALQAYSRKVEAAGVANAEERKTILSRIAREIGNHDPADYIEAGADGAYITFGKESPNRLAIGGVKSRTEIIDTEARDKKGNPIQCQAVITELKLRDPSVAIKAIDTMNRMDGVYRDQENDSVTVELNVYGADRRPLGRVTARKKVDA